MDPATLKMVLQLAQVLGKSKMVRAVLGGILALSVGTGAATAYGAWMLTTSMSSSLSVRQQFAMDGNCGRPTAIATSASGTSSATKGELAVWKALAAAGFDPVHRAGVMGNMKAESGFDAQIVQGGGHSTRPADAGGGGYGLVQWTPGRKLSDYIGSATPTVGNQIETLKAQLEGRGPHPEKAAGDAFWATTDVESAARVFHLRYERSASTNSTQRVRNALSIMQRLQTQPEPSAAPAPPAVPAAEPASPDVGCRPGSMPAAKIITWNSFHGRRWPDQAHGNDQRVVDGMLELAKVGNIIGGQELSDSDRKAAVNKAMDGVGWAFVATHTSHPIYFDRSVWTLEQDDTAEVYERGDSIEGNDQGDRYVVTAVLRSKVTGQLLTVINMHQLPHIQKHGVLNRKQPKRIRMAVAAWRVMAATVAKRKPTSAVVVVGDMNYDGDPRGMYAAAGLTMASKVFGSQDTLRKREIDQILFTAGRPVSQQILGRYGSDHHARMVTFAATASAPTTSSGSTGTTPAGFNFPGQKTVDQAIAYMSRRGRVTPGSCLHEVGAAYGHHGTTRVNGHFYATGQWDAMPAGFKHTDGSPPPRGALVFWDTSNVAGHIAISAGGGKVWTTDPDGHRGTVALVDISMPDGWGQRLGWSPPFFVGKTHLDAKP